jgi:hypothetical protein
MEIKSDSRKMIYYCYQCKKISNDKEDFFFIDFKYKRNFCTEKCISKFFKPLTEYLIEHEIVVRKMLDVQEDIYQDVKYIESMVDETLANPDEIWDDDEGKGEHLFYFIKKINTENQVHIFVILGLILAEDHFTFILWNTVTYDQKIVNYYRNGKKIHHEGNSYQDHISSSKKFNDDHVEHHDSSSLLQDHDSSWPLYQKENQDHSFNEQNEIMLDKHDFSEVEKMRSEYLEKLMKLRDAHDIPYDDFKHYESYIEQTLSTPDEVFYEQHANGKTVVSFLKNFQRLDGPFFYAVLALLHDSSLEDDRGLEETLIPIISFPSRDHHLYHHFRKGTKKNYLPKS